MDAKSLREQADELFNKRSSLMMLFQETADNFYPERADFTVNRSLGTDFAAHLQTSYPVLCRREFGDQIGSMLRNTAKPWFEMVVRDQPKIDHDAKKWLQWATGTMRRAMYDPITQFTRATKEGDHDFATFGQCVISAEVMNYSHMLYRCWHLRDVAWMENEQGDIGFVSRKWKPRARDLVRLFNGKVDQKITRLAEKKPFEECNVYHIVCDADMYDDDARGKPRWSIYYDCENNKIIEATPVRSRIYRIPRWQTVSGSQYAFSPATVAGLPDARLLQAMTLTLLEAGEKIVNPPMIATIDAVRSDMALFPGGATWIDREYDERLGEALRPITIDAKGMPLSQELIRDTRSMLMQAFYLNKLTLPQRSAEMTAYEVGQRVQEYIRGALPLFEPMEMSYNGGICEETFDSMLHAGAFGSPMDMPKSLSGADIQFQFVSPLHDAIEQSKGQKFLEMKQLLAEAVSVDQNAAAVPDVITAFRDALDGVGVPVKWVRSKDESNAIVRQNNEQIQQQQLLDSLEQSSKTAANLTKAQEMGGTMVGAQAA